MKLLIEHGQLLMPYVAPWLKKKQRHRKPKAWTPTRTPTMQAEFATLKEEHPTTPDHILWAQVERDEAERMTRKPWPGWVPQVYAKGGIDKELGDAYKALHLLMNDEYADLLARGVPLNGLEVEWPADGDYVFERGEMRAV